jgi:hypothetical protein
MSNAPGMGGVHADMAERAANHVEPVCPRNHRVTNSHGSNPGPRCALDGQDCACLRPATHGRMALGTQRRHFRAASSALDGVFWSTASDLSTIHAFTPRPAASTRTCCDARAPAICGVRGTSERSRALRYRSRGGDRAPVLAVPARTAAHRPNSRARNLPRRRLAGRGEFWPMLR